MFYYGTESGRCRAEIPECDRVAKRVNWRNAVFPIVTRGAPQQIRGPRLGCYRHPFPAAAGLSPESKGAGGKKRNADNVAENCFVAVPSDGGPGIVFRYEHLLQLSRVNSSEFRGNLAQGKKERRNVVRLEKLLV